MTDTSSRLRMLRTLFGALVVTATPLTGAHIKPKPHLSPVTSLKSELNHDLTLKTSDLLALRAREAKPVLRKLEGKWTLSAKRVYDVGTGADICYLMDQMMVEAENSGVNFERVEKNRSETRITAVGQKMIGGKLSSANVVFSIDEGRPSFTVELKVPERSLPSPDTAVKDAGQVCEP